MSQNTVLSQLSSTEADHCQAVHIPLKQQDPKMMEQAEKDWYRPVSSSTSLLAFTCQRLSSHRKVLVLNKQLNATHCNRKCQENMPKDKTPSKWSRICVFFVWSVDVAIFKVVKSIKVSRQHTVPHFNNRPWPQGSVRKYLSFYTVYTCVFLVWGFSCQRLLYYSTIFKTLTFIILPNVTNVCTYCCILKTVNTKTINCHDVPS